MMKEANDFYKEIDNEKRQDFFGKHWNRVGMCKSNIFRFISLYSWHSCLNSNKKLTLDRYSAEKMLKNILTAFIRQEKPDWNLSI